MELTEFVRARLGEQEDAWRGGLNLQTRPDFSRLSEQMLAQVAAMRQVIRQAEMLAEYVDATREHEAYRYEPTLHRLLAPLASIWRQHGDYDPSWSPDA